MTQAQLNTGSGSVRSSDSMKGLVDLFGRNPMPAPLEMHVERLPADWREALNPDDYTDRLDALREGLLDSIALAEEGAADVHPASKVEARQAAAVVASMRTAYTKSFRLCLAGLARRGDDLIRCA